MLLYASHFFLLLLLLPFDAGRFIAKKKEPIDRSIGRSIDRQTDRQT